jgi:hypothetical protein
VFIFGTIGIGAAAFMGGVGEHIWAVYREREPNMTLFFPGIALIVVGLVFHVINKFTDDPMIPADQKTKIVTLLIQRLFDFIKIGSHRTAGSEANRNQAAGVPAATTSSAHLGPEDT